MELPEWLRGRQVSDYGGHLYIKAPGNTAFADTQYSVERHWGGWPEEVQEGVTKVSLVEFEQWVGESHVFSLSSSRGDRVIQLNDGDIRVNWRHGWKSPAGALCSLL